MPDSATIGFFAGGKLKKVAIAGGPALVLCDAPSGRGGTWNRENVIVFTPSTGAPLQRVSSAGGTPVDATAIDAEYGETNHRFPFFLPDGRHFLYTATVGTCCPPTKPARVKIGRLDTMESTILLQVESAATYASGHLLFNRDGTLMAQPFDAGSRALTGDAFPVAERIANEGSRYASFSVSDGGVLAYAPGLGPFAGRLTWLDRAGRELGTIGEGVTFLNLSLSPDERHVAAADGSVGTPNRDIWLYDAESGAPTRLTFNPAEDNGAVWSPDGQRIAFFTSREGAPAIHAKVVGSAADDEPLLEQPPGRGTVTPTGWSPDGRYVLYGEAQVAAGGASDVWVLPLFGDRTPFPYLQTPAFETDASFSPDQRWVVYTSSDNVDPEVYVQPFPATGGKFQISPHGGVKPVGRRDGKELFFLEPGRMMAVAIEVTPAGTFRAGVPKALFSLPTIAFGATGRQYDVSGDGQRFIVNIRAQQSASTPLIVRTNWLPAATR